MARQRNGALRSFLATLTLGFMWVNGKLSLGMSRRLGRTLGSLAYALLPRIRRVAYDNVDKAYGNTLAPKEKKWIAKGSAQNLGIVAAEFAHIRRLSKQDSSREIAIRGAKNLDPDKGTLIVFAHMGNWEWLSLALRRLGRGMHGVVRPLNDPRLDRVVESTRAAAGASPIPRENAGPEMIRLLREGDIVGVLVDQSPRENAVPTTFFGQPCWSTIAPVMIALRSKADIHITYVARQPDGSYEVVIEPAMSFERTGNLRADLVANTQRVQDAIERVVRYYPEQWLWMHRRWKARKHLEEEWAARERKGKKVSGHNEEAPDD